MLNRNKVDAVQACAANVKRVRARFGVGEYRSALQAVVNLGRVPLATALGYALPTTALQERRMWGNVTRFVVKNQRADLAKVDGLRLSSLPAPADGPADRRIPNQSGISVTGPP